MPPNLILYCSNTHIILTYISINEINTIIFPIFTTPLTIESIATLKLIPFLYAFNVPNTVQSYDNVTIYARNNDLDK